MQFIKGPDFPTGGVILGTGGFKEAYRTGRGRVRVRAKAHTEQLKGNRTAIIVTELPYQVNRAALIDNIVDLVKSKKLTEISDLRNESDRSGMRLVIELKREAIPMVVLNKLYKHTQMQTTFGDHQHRPGRRRAAHAHAARDAARPTSPSRKRSSSGAPSSSSTRPRRGPTSSKACSSRSTTSTRSSAIIRKAPDVGRGARRAHGHVRAHAAAGSGHPRPAAPEAHRLERDKVKEEHAGLLARIKELRELLGDEARIYGVIKDELLEIKRLYNDDRRTEIVPDEGEIDIEDLIAEEQMAITITKTGYVKRIPVATYRQQKRGGIGVAGMELKEEDEVEHLFITTTHNFLLFFTSVGKVYRLKVHELPLAGRNAKRQAHRQPAAAAPGREDLRRHQHAQLRRDRGQVPHLRHAQGHREEDALRQLQHAAQERRHHRHRHPRGRRAAGRAPHLRRRRRHDDQPPRARPSASTRATSGPRAATPAACTA